MNKKVFGMITIVVMTLVLIENVCSDTIRAAGIVYCPYTCDVSKDGQDGFMIDIAKTIFQKAGHTYTVTMFPFKRALEYVKRGHYDALAICNKADVPKDGLIFPETPIAVINNTFAIRKADNWTYDGVNSLRKIMIGTVLGYTFKDEKLNHYLLATDKVQRVSGIDVTERNLKKLLAGRIDAYIDDGNMIMRTALQMRIVNKIKFVGIVDSTPHYIGFTPGQEKSLRYARILSDGMRNLRETGELDIILSEYDLKDWKHEE